jgi:hypothetical protein
LGVLLPLIFAILVSGALALRWAWRRYPDDRHWLIAAATGLVSCLAAAVILRIEGQAGAGAVGWPLVLSLPLLPFRVIGWIDVEVAFGVGLAVSILANAATVFATAFIGLRATGSRRLGLVAAALFAFWPFLVLALLGEQTWENSAWEIETGLGLYTEPLSTACVASALALVLAKQAPWATVAAGILFGYGIAVRPTNVVFALAAAIMLVVSERDWRGAWRLAVGGLTILPIVLAFLPKKRGYDLELARDPSGEPLWSSGYFFSAFSDSSVWRPLLLTVLLPLVAVGIFAVRSRGVAFLLVGGAVANAVIYGFFRATPEHPRYLQAGLPALLVVWVAGAAWLSGKARRGARQAQVRSS